VTGSGRKTVKTTESGPLADERIEFSGKVIASISHELKNALATVGESAGLLSDLLKEPEVDDELRQEMRTCGETISDELKRAFAIIRNLNTFAHTADEALRETDIARMTELIATLSGYRSNARPVHVEDPTGGAAKVHTCPLLYQDLVYGILLAAFRLRGQNDPIEVTIGSREGGAEIRFRELGSNRLDEVLAEPERRILGMLHGGVTLDAEAGVLEVRLPPSIETGNDPDAGGTHE
jgi:light-regulated signal transduction histidine kinase (bacteriophytochrome)